MQQYAASARANTLLLRNAEARRESAQNDYCLGNDPTTRTRVTAGKQKRAAPAGSKVPGREAVMTTERHCRLSSGGARVVVRRSSTRIRGRFSPSRRLTERRRRSSADGRGGFSSAFSFFISGVSRAETYAARE